MLFSSGSCRFKKFVRSVASLFLGGLVTAVGLLPVYGSESVNLAWSASSDTNIVGYKIYFGTVSHNYTQSVNVGNVTNATITVPAAGTTYYFAATSYNSSGVESDFSNEATFVAPGKVTLTTAKFSAGRFTFTVNGTTNARYIVEASTNLADWVPVQTNTAPFTFAGAQIAKQNRCFYRVVAP